MANTKKRDTIHISYNDKKYYNDMKEIVSTWDSEGDVRSKKVCEDILHMEKIRNSMTLNKLLNTFEWIENTLLPGFADKNDPQFKHTVEQVFSGVINIDGNKLSEFILNPDAKIEESKKHFKEKEAIAQREVASTSVHSKEETCKENLIEKKDIEENIIKVNNAIKDEDSAIKNTQNISEGNTEKNILEENNKGTNNLDSSNIVIHDSDEGNSNSIPNPNAKTNIDKNNDEDNNNHKRFSRRNLGSFN